LFVLEQAMKPYLLSTAKIIERIKHGQIFQIAIHYNKCREDQPTMDTTI